MRSLLSVFISMLCVTVGYAQWSNTSNNFADSLHMPVSYQPGEQYYTITINSYPDKGTIILWLDGRTTGNQTDIYAQKVDADGNNVWTTDGVPVATGATDQRFGWANNAADYRYYSYACTDSAGGFYVAWEDYIQIGSYNFQRVCVQHVKADGTRVFGETGFVAGNPDAEQNLMYRYPQLVADGQGGFFIGFFRLGGYGKSDLLVYNYRDEAGTMVNHAGVKMDPDIIQGTGSVGGCGFIRKYYEYNVDDRVTQFYLYPDLQQGCGVVWSFDRNTAQPDRGPFIAYNKLCRVKKNCTTVVRKRTSDLANTMLITTQYQKDELVLLYNFRGFVYTDVCLPNTQLMEIIENGGEGYLLLDAYTDANPVYDWYNLKAGIVQTGGNMNAGLVAVVERKYMNGAVTPFYVKGIFRHSEEVYDSIPFQLSSDTEHPYWAYRLGKPADLLKTNFGADTLLGSSTYYFDYDLDITGSRILATAKFPDPSYANGNSIKIQEWKFEQQSLDSFAVKLNSSSNTGVIAGKEINTGAQVSNINYADNPSITTDDNGNALFQIAEYGRFIRVSPLDIGGKLLWGAMGRPIGNAFSGSFSTAALKEQGTGVIVWHDARYIAPNSYYNNIYMRHLGGLTTFNITPPLKMVKKLANNQVTILYPYLLTGMSNSWSVFEAYQNSDWTTALEILDDHNLGNVKVGIYQNNGLVRQTNGQPYLDRNFTIVPENNTPGGAPVQMRLYFTTEEFDALAEANAAIKTPADLIIVKQPNINDPVPAVYTKAATDEILTPVSWNAVEGGYYVQVAVESFSNFFIMGAQSVLPLTWVSVNANWLSPTQASVHWETADQQNVKDFVVEYSQDGTRFQPVCTVPATAIQVYSCTIPVNNNSRTHYFRVMERDFEGRLFYSPVATLTAPHETGFTVVPNPAFAFAELRTTRQNDKIKTVILYNSMGVRVYTQQVVDAGNTLKIPLKNLPAGVYTLQVISDKGASSSKLLKQ